MLLKNISEAQEYSHERFKKGSLFKEKGSSAFVLNFMPGQELPAHRHPGHDVYLFVFEGEGECTIDGETHSLAWRDVIHCNEEEELSLKNSGQKLMSVYVVLAKNM